MNPGKEPQLRSVLSPAGRQEIPEEIIRYAALPAERRELLLHVNALLDEIVYGNVVIVMQDGTVIQIETSEKIRLDSRKPG